MVNLVVCIIGQDCGQFIDMCYESVKDADRIVFCDGGSSDGTTDYLKSKKFVWEPIISSKPKRTMIFQKFDEYDPQMNGKQRNFYLDYLQKKYPHDWVLCLDADEVLADNGITVLKKLIKQELPPILSPRIHHFIGDLGHEDFTIEKHYAPHRFFKILDAERYSEVEHSLLRSKNPVPGMDMVEIWHLRETLGIFGTNKKHLWNTLKSNIHNQTFLNHWNKTMIMGTYPRKQVNYADIPTPIKKKFMI